MEQSQTYHINEDAPASELMRGLGRNKKLMHFTDSKIEGALYDVTEQKTTDKPKGFWISVEGGGDGWKDWCEAEDFELVRLKVSYEITLVEEPNIKIITNALDLDCFHEKYKEALGETYVRDYINWNRVAEEYKGIIIAPYIWERRLRGDASRWYYGWDCASGCIWDTSAIDTIELVAP